MGHQVGSQFYCKELWVIIQYPSDQRKLDDHSDIRISD